MTNYARGAALERRAKRDLEERGAFVIRAAGSHGPVDLIALWHSGVPGPWLIQCKRDGKLSVYDRDELRVVADCYAAEAYVCQPGARGRPPEFERL